MVDVRDPVLSGAAVTAPAVRGRVLVVDDDPAFRRLGANWLRSLGHEVETAGDAEAGATLAATWAPEAVVLDLSMPPHLDPAAGIANVARFAPAPVIVLTGHADGAHALAAIEAGAWDFLAKPADPAMLAVVVARAVAKARLEDEVRRLRREGETGDLGLAGASPALSRLRDGIRRLGPTKVPVVVLGPTGTGKELVARALHALGPGRDRPFTVVHCGALPGDLLEAELFGHVKGSFTGAHRDSPGLLDAAHGGTLFLDEVGDMPAPLQVKLLRFLQEGTFTPVGARHPRRADARVVSATHRDLAAMVAAGTFREDLFYRLKGMVLRTPSLAERPGDAALLANLFARRAAGGRRLAPDAMPWIAAREWPGNVRELRAVVETACALAGPAEAVDIALLAMAAGEEPPSTVAEESTSAGPLDAALAALETRLVSEALAAAGGNKSEAARRLGVTRVGLGKKIVRLGLSPGSRS